MGGIIDANNEIIKIKGFKDHLNYHELKSLLNKDTKVQLNQEKGFRNIEEVR